MAASQQERSKRHRERKKALQLAATRVLYWLRLARLAQVNSSDAPIFNSALAQALDASAKYDALLDEAENDFS